MQNNSGSAAAVIRKIIIECIKRADGQSARFFNRQESVGLEPVNGICQVSCQIRGFRSKGFIDGLCAQYSCQADTGGILIHDHRSAVGTVRQAESEGIKIGSLVTELILQGFRHDGVSGIAPETCKGIVIDGNLPVFAAVFHKLSVSAVVCPLVAADIDKDADMVVVDFIEEIGRDIDRQGINGNFLSAGSGKGAAVQLGQLKPEIIGIMGIT